MSGLHLPNYVAAHDQLLEQALVELDRPKRNQVVANEAGIAGGVDPLRTVLIQLASVIEVELREAFHAVEVGRAVIPQGEEPNRLGGGPLMERKIPAIEEFPGKCLNSLRDLPNQPNAHRLKDNGIRSQMSTQFLRHDTSLALNLVLSNSFYRSDR
jgi:hypothetical protein